MPRRNVSTVPASRRPDFSVKMRFDNLVAAASCSDGAERFSLPFGPTTTDFVVGSNSAQQRFEQWPIRVLSVFAVHSAGFLVPTASAPPHRLPRGLHHVRTELAENRGFFYRSPFTASRSKKELVLRFCVLIAASSQWRTSAKRQRRRRPARSSCHLGTQPNFPPRGKGGQPATPPKKCSAICSESSVS